MSAKKSLQKEHTAMETASTREKSPVISRPTFRKIVRILGKAALIIPVITALVLGACQSPDSAPAPAVISETTDLPTSTEDVKFETSTPTPTSTPIPELKFEKVTNLAEMDKMSTITLEDLKPGSAFSKWGQEQLDKMGPIASNPQAIDYVNQHLKSSDVYGLTILNRDTANKGVRATELFSLFKIDLEPWGFPGKIGLVASYVYEDKDGNQAMVELFFPVSATTLPQHESLFKDPRGRRLIPVDKISGALLDKMFFDQNPGGDGDLREVARKFYEAQEYTHQQIQGLFQRIANSDSLTGEDKQMLESIIFLGRDLIVSE